MKSLLQEIREQPEHIRHVFMWLCVVITFSIVGFIGFRSTTRQFVALLHPEEAQERALAEKALRQGFDGELSRTAQGKQPSPFATISNSWSFVRANIYELFVGPKSLEINNDPAAVDQEQTSPQKLPISEDK